YRSKAFATALGEQVTHKRTRPYRPQTNGKVERFNRTLEQEWAYARPYTSEAERIAELPAFLHTYNHHRGHTALKGHPPASRVPNLCGDNNLVPQSSPTSCTTSSAPPFSPRNQWSAHC